MTDASATPQGTTHCRPCTRQQVLRAASVGGLMLTLVACSPLASMPPMADPPSTAYRLGAGDQLRVVTYNDPQMSNTFTVSDRGTIAFPLIGEINAQGLTSNEFGERISETLTTRGVLHHPSVSVEVAEYRPIFVLGEVSHPGQYRYLPGMTTQAAVAMAGGYTYRAITHASGVVRTEGTPTGKPVQGQVLPSSLLEPGDVITVYERYF